MRDEYDFSRGTRGVHVARIRSSGSLLVESEDGAETRVLTASDLEPTRRAGLRYFRSCMQQFDAPFAQPVNDHEIDLIAYLRERGAVRFSACPVVLKASSGERVEIRTRDASVPNLLLAFVWHARSQHPEMYAVPSAALHSLFRERNYTESRSYSELGGWSVPSPDESLRAFMYQHRVTSGEMWYAEIRAALETR